MLNFSRTWLVALPLVAAASASAQTLPGTDGTPQLRRLPAATAAQLRQLPIDSRQLLREQLALRPTDDMQPLRVETDERGEAHERYQQTYRGVKVEHGVYTVHRAAGLLSGELKPVPASFGTKPVLSAAAALQSGMNAVGATRYMWNDPAAEAGLQATTGNPRASYRPVGELVIVEDYRQREAANRPLVLAWKFNIYAQQPESRAWVYVDARTGEVVLQDAIIKHAHGLVEPGTKAPGRSATQLLSQKAAQPLGQNSTVTGTFATRYLGSRQVATDLFNGTHRLRDYTRASGIETYNLRGSGTLPAAGAGADFTDVDNNWTAGEFNNAANDNAALDAHFGSTQVYDYWLTVHGRNSFDGRGGKLINYVHFRTLYDNASWDGTAMRYGDGNTLFNPLTCLDVCAHETGHGICQETANLVYMNESGALNEGFSDIWGASVEYFTDPTKQTWTVGEDIARNSGGLRSMSDPRSTAVLNPCPANYRGQLWNFGTSDQGGVHTNSGVLNHWYYILSVGKTGVNERGQAYAVTGLGLTRAARIAFRAERLYLTSNSDYRSARMYTIQAAEDLFGANSPEVQAVTDAWFAVGLGNSANAPAGAQAQCLTDDAPVVTAASPVTAACVGSPFTLTGTAVMPTQRRLRSAASVSLPDGGTAYTAVPVYNSATVAGGTTLQHGLEQFYTSYTALGGVRVRISHARPDQVALRLAVTGSTGGLRYVPLAFALPTYNGAGPATIDITFADNATATLPTTMSGNTLTGTFRPQTLLGSIAPGPLRSISVEALDGQAGTAGTVDAAELIFPRLAFDVATMRWVGSGIDAAGASVTVTPPAPASGGSATYRYTFFASDPYFGCTSSQTLDLTVRQTLLVAQAQQPELCAGRGLPFGPATLRVTQDDSLPGQTYRWTGPSNFASTGKRRLVQPALAGRLRYVVSTTIPGTTCARQQAVVLMARRPVAATPAGIDTVVAAGTAARLRSRALENQLSGGPYAFTGSTPVPDNNPAGVRIPLIVAGPAEGFFELRGIRVTATHSYMRELEIYVEAPDGTRVLLSKANGGGGPGYQSTLFVDSVGARVLSTGAAPFAGTWQVDEPTGFAALRNATQAGTWNLWVRDTEQNDTGRILNWSIETTKDPVSWSGPAFAASGAAVLSPVLTVPGHYRYIATTRSGGCTFRDTVNVRVAGPLDSRAGAAGLAVSASPVPFGATGFVLHLPTTSGVVSVAVYDLAGRLLLRRMLPGSADISLPEAGSLPSGVYQVRIAQGQTTRMLRVTRE